MAWALDGSKYLRHAQDCNKKPCNCGIKELQDLEKKDIQFRCKLNNHSQDLFIACGELVFELNQVRPNSKILKTAKALLKKLEQEC